MESTRPLRSRAARQAQGLREVPTHLLRSFASLFEISDPAARTNTRTLVLLVAILALATFVRFLGLGAVGLHGDEETMAMPTMHIVEHGSPLLPSGMLYPRAVAQLYMMAGSVMAFGQSEWAMRVPTAICGVLVVLLAFGVGKRFLTPAWNIAFTAAVAFLPEFIVDAQTARMYTFLVGCVAGYMLLLFEWERTDRAIYLAAAVVVLLIGVQFHTLAVFAAFMALYPGLVRGEIHKVVLGSIAFAAIVAGFVSIDHWIATQYPDASDVAGDGDETRGARAAAAVPHIAAWMAAVAMIGAAAIATFVVRRVNGRAAAIGAGALITLGLAALATFNYHIAALLLIAGVVIARRYGGASVQRLAPLVVICGAVAAAQFFLLYQNHAGPLRQILGAMTGRPSLWPLIAIGEYSLAAVLLFAAGIVVALWRVARGGRAPDYVLLGVLGVWLPLLLIGVLKWDVPMRYTAAQIFPLLLCAFAAAQTLFGKRWQGALAAIVAVLVINPIALARTVNSGYRDHPDHQGAALFIRSLHLGPRDIVIAEDVLQQTYYLGHVDYWLYSREAAGQFVRPIDGQLEDFYTNTPLIGTADGLQRLLASSDRGAIYVIGSGEEQEDGRLHARGPGLSQLLASPRFKEIWRGRDGLTTVLKVPAPGAAE